MRPGRVMWTFDGSQMVRKFPDPDTVWRDGVPREVIDYERIPREIATLDYLRLLGWWIAAAMPETTFICERFTVEKLNADSEG